MKKACALVSAVVIAFSVAGAVPPAFAADASASVPQGLYTLEDEGAYNRFTNFVGGYSLLVDKDLRVDMRIAGVCATLEGPDKRISIFNQKLGGGVSASDYIAYSNGFLSNWTDHYLEYNGTQEIGGRNVHVTLWSRGRLSRIDNDKCYYACLDIPAGDGEYVTVLVSSSAPLHRSGGYAYPAEGFRTVPKSAPPYIRRGGSVNAAFRGWNEETETFYEHYFGAESPLTWGIFEPHAPGNIEPLKEYEALVDYSFPILLNYSNFENVHKHPNLLQRLESAHKNGRTLELTLQTSAVQSPGESNAVYAILNGAYDAFLTDYAETVAAFGHPVLFRLGNEMNGDWCPYAGYNTSRDPRIFVEFYRYVYSFFERADARNVIWIWNPNGKSFPNFTWNDALMYYPGDEYVDVVGLTAYNTGDYYPGETWKSFAELYDNIYYSYVEKYEKPLMITEFASAVSGGDKNQWVLDMFAHIRYYDRIKVAVWWDGADYDSNGRIARNYFIDDPKILTETFRRSLRGAFDERPADVLWKQDTFV
ncbi:MAG: glycoside hydrolase family 26 protein [Clostridiales Family XIII bacterium]|nr:glycoside hydrolase family 26 protein [Clostridiales Family XIII bacterium]